MIVAHLSDPHFLDLHGVPLRRLLAGKRLTGALNLLLRRRRAHRQEIAERLAEDLRERSVDHVVITGDMTNLALDPEFARAAAWLTTCLGFSSDRVSIVPGNHDRYTRRSARCARFEQWFNDYTRSDLPWEGGVAFPFLRLRGPLAIIGMDSAVPRPPFLAAGQIGAAQCDRLATLLAHPDVASRTVLVALHHPPIRLPSRHWANGLRDWSMLREALGEHSPGLVLHGHLHTRMVSDLVTASGTWPVVGATSASLAHGDARKSAGFNEYVFDDAGLLRSMRARVLSPDTRTFETRELRKQEG